MHSDPTLTRLPVEREDDLYHVLRKKLRQNATVYLFSSDHVWRTEQTSGMSKHLRGPESRPWHKPASHHEGQRRMSLEKPFGSSVRQGGHHFFVFLMKSLRTKSCWIYTKLIRSPGPHNSHSDILFGAWPLVNYHSLPQFPHKQEWMHSNFTHLRDVL